ncbi:peptide chain release factor 1 [Burkholderia pseudomallei 576]|nr:peptide chain release factor 1 [Burkholderia pseudomallei 576]
MVELSLKTRGQGRGGGANEFGPARARHRPLRPFGQATFCSGVPTPGAAAARSPAGCAGGVARYRSAWGKSLACRLPLAACRLPLAAHRLPLIAYRLPFVAGRRPRDARIRERGDARSRIARGARARSPAYRHARARHSVFHHVKSARTRLSL